MIDDDDDEEDDNKRERNPPDLEGQVQMADGNSNNFPRNLLFPCLVVISLHTQEFVMSRLFYNQ